jgi:hypothetical protein
MCRGAAIDGSEYFPQFWDAWWHNEELWGLMVTSNSQVVAYQRRSWQKWCRTRPTRRKAAPSSMPLRRASEKWMPTATSSASACCLPGLTWWGRVFGGSFYDAANQKITADDPKVVAALEWEASFRQRLSPEKVAAFQSGFGDYMSTQNSFFVGKEAMTQVGEWFIQFQKSLPPTW